MKDSSIERIVVESGEIDTPLTAGGTATITATVFWTSVWERVDFFYTNTPLSPEWHFIGSLSPSQPGTVSNGKYPNPQQFQDLEVSLDIIAYQRCLLGFVSQVTSFYRRFLTQFQMKE